MSLKELMYCFWFFISFSFIEADVKSTLGTIRFDTQGDGIPELSLTDTGLGIGTALPEGNLHVMGNTIVTNKVFVGGSVGTSNLTVNGTIGFGVTSISSNTTLGTDSMVLVDGSSQPSNLVISLPDASFVNGRTFTIKKLSSEGNVQVQSETTTNSSNVIDQVGHVMFEDGLKGALSLLSDGSSWHALSSYEVTFGPPVSGENLLLWIDPSNENSVQLNSDGNVAFIADLSGKEHHLSETSSAPEYATADFGINNKRALLYNYGNFLKNNDTGHPRNPHAEINAYFVFQSSSGNSSSYASLYSIGTNPSRIAYTHFNNSGHHAVHLDLNNQNKWSASSSFDGSLNLVSFSIDISGNVEHYKNGSNKMTSSFTTYTLPVTGSGVMILGDSGAGFVGKIGEILIYDVVHSESERLAVEAYLLDKWGL